MEDKMEVHFIYSDYPLFLWLPLLFLSILGSFLLISAGLLMRRYEREGYQSLRNPLDYLGERRKIFKSILQLVWFVVGGLGMLYGLYYPIGFGVFLGIHFILSDYSPTLIAILAPLLQIVSWYFMMYSLFFKRVYESVEGRRGEVSKVAV